MTNYKLLADAVRMLSADSVEKAKSGHPGAPMGMADMATVLWKDHLHHSPMNPNWINRDRFVLSNGHASMLLYSLLHLTGYRVSINDLKDTYNPSTDIIEQIELSKETLFYIKRKKREQTLNSILE